MPDISQQVLSEISPFKSTDPRLYRAFQLLNQQMRALTVRLEPLEANSELENIGVSEDLDAPAFTYIFTGTTLRFLWAAIDGAQSYEVRLGSSWSTASFVLRTVNLQADIDPILTGTYTYLIKSIDSTFAYSASSGSLTVTVPPIMAVTINGQVIDNTVALSWTAPASAFNIDHYKVYRDSTLIGTVKGTYTTFFETVSATYTYGVVAVDIAGNEGATGTIDLAVKQPPDFALQATFISALDGTLNDTIIEEDELVGPIETSETWADHFVNNGWTTIQNQIDAGYPLYFQPAKTPGIGYYEELIDFGVLFGSTIATLTFNYTMVDLAHVVSVVIKMQWSDDNITFTSYTSGASQFMQNMRYLRFKVELTASDGNALIRMSNLTMNLQVKREDDGGEVDALAADVGGTSVSFNKLFKDIDKVTATAKSTVPLTVVVDFVDIPDPTGFSVYVFDDTGVRVDNRVEWHARGVV